MWILGLKGLKPGMPDLLLYKYNEKSCFFVFFSFFFLFFLSGCGLLWDIYGRFQNGHVYQTN